jgi:hypothetical protein
MGHRHRTQSRRDDLADQRNQPDVKGVAQILLGLSSAGSGPPLSGAATWNPSDASSNIVLAAGNLQYGANSSADGGCRATHAESSGKYYFELTLNAMLSGDNGVGIALGSASLSTIGTDATGSCVIFGSGNIWFNGSNQGNYLSSFGSETPVNMGIAVDCGNAKIWFRLNGGNWNGNSSANPATDTDGFDIGALFPSGTPIYPCAASNQNDSDICVANFGESAFTYTPPSGFTTGWPGS